MEFQLREATEMLTLNEKKGGGVGGEPDISSAKWAYLGTTKNFILGHVA